MCGFCLDHGCFQENAEPKATIFFFFFGAQTRSCTCWYVYIWNSHSKASSKDCHDCISLIVWIWHVDVSMQLILLPIHRLSTVHSKHSVSFLWFSRQLFVFIAPNYSPLILTWTYCRQVAVQLPHSESPYSLYTLGGSTSLSLGSTSVPIASPHHPDCNRWHDLNSLLYFCFIQIYDFKCHWYANNFQELRALFFNSLLKTIWVSQNIWHLMHYNQTPLNGSTLHGWIMLLLEAIS